MKPPKKIIVTDTFEHFKDVGREVAKETGRAFSLDSFLTGLYGPSPETKEEIKAKEDQEKNLKSGKEKGKNIANATPLDLETLRKKHRKSQTDEMALDKIRDRLFNNIKSEEQSAKAYFENKKEEKAKEENVEKRQKEEDVKRRLATQQSQDAPQGKEQRGGLFAKKRRKQVSTDENRAEYRGSGKH